MVIDLFVHRFRGERDVLARRTIIYNFEVRASRTETTCARTESQTRCYVFGVNNLFFTYRIAFHVNQPMRSYVR